MQLPMFNHDGLGTNFTLCRLFILRRRRIDDRDRPPRLLLRQVRLCLCRHWVYLLVDDSVSSSGGAPSHPQRRRFLICASFHFFNPFSFPWRHGRVFPSFYFFWGLCCFPISLVDICLSDSSNFMPKKYLNSLIYCYITWGGNLLV